MSTLATLQVGSWVYFFFFMILEFFIASYFRCDKMLKHIKHIPYLDLRPTISLGSSSYFYLEVILSDYNLSSRCSLLPGLMLPRCVQWTDSGFFFFFFRKQIMYSLKINMHIHFSVSNWIQDCKDFI